MTDKNRVVFRGTREMTDCVPSLRADDGRASRQRVGSASDHAPSGPGRQRHGNALCRRRAAVVPLDAPPAGLVPDPVQTSRSLQRPVDGHVIQSLQGASGSDSASLCFGLD